MNDRTETTAAVSSLNTSAVLLLFASMFIITGGGVAVGYVLVKRKSMTVRRCSRCSAGILIRSDPTPGGIVVRCERTIERERGRGVPAVH
jgi:hypothetical protein